MGRVHTFVDGDDLSDFDSTFWGELVAAALPRLGSGTSWGAGYAGPGCVARLGVVVGIVPDETKVLDAEIDWRDRVITVAAVVYQPAEWSLTYDGPIYPGNPNDDLSRASSVTSAVSSGYTGLGRDGSDYLTLFGDDLALFADDTTGELKIQRSVTDALPAPESIIIYVMASEQTGQRSVPDPLPAILSVFDTPIEPHFLNGLQDRSMLGQVRDSGTTESDAFPLGPKLDAHGIPRLWRERGFLRRQPVAGQVRRFFWANPGAGAEVVIDDTVDWRDRFVWGVGRRSALAIGAGGVDDTAHNAATPWDQARYTGPGSSGALADRGYGLRLIDGTSGLQIRARSTDGALVIRNGTAAMIHVTGVVTGSFQLGPRS